MDEKDKREKYIKFLFELNELPEAIMGLQVLFFFFSFFSSAKWTLDCSLFLLPHSSTGKSPTVCIFEYYGEGSLFWMAKEVIYLCILPTCMRVCLMYPAA